VIDPGRVRAKLTLLRRYRARLARLAALPRETYVAEHDFEGRYAVQAAAQACLDLANHVIASEGWPPAADFPDSFSRLEEQAVIDAELAERMRALAGQRNLLVHLYGEVDDALVHAFLQDGLADLDRFARAVAALMDDPPSQ
jgi:uncharacterized protein YutE (UPF0331/DUF86 family)